jgi:spore maturation protein CgeD
MPTVSIILVSFNRPHMIDRAINSVLAQTFTDWELWVADFSSNQEKKDEIVKKISALAEKDPRVHLKDFPCLTEEENTNSAPYATKINETFPFTTGKYIAYLVDDDKWKNTHLQRCLGVFEKVKDASVVYSGQVVMEDMGQGETMSHMLPASIIRRCLFASADHIAVMHTREVFEKAGGWSNDERVRQFGDAEFFYRIWEAGFLAYPTKYITTVKYLHGKNLNINGGCYEA